MISRTAKVRTTLIAGSWAARKPGPDSAILQVGKSEMIGSGHMESEDSRRPFRLTVSIERFDAAVAKVIEMLALSQPWVHPDDFHTWSRTRGTTYYNRYPAEQGQQVDLDISRQCGIIITVKLNRIISNTDGVPQAGEFEITRK